MQTPVEHEQQICAWNQTATDYPRDLTVQALFERQAARTPEAIAIEFGSQCLSYAELNQRANRVAHYLLARGVTAEVRVGLFMERSLEMVVALLGILKAGGAYVPLDLEYPSSRIAFMLDDSQAAVLISVSTLAAGIPDFCGETVLLDRDWSEIEKSDMRNPELGCVAENLAYVIYTSGSTGTPKGVEIQHRAINRLVKDTDYYQVNAEDRILQASNVSFDAATFELWGALLNGARLVGIDKESFLQPKTLVAFLREKHISAMFVTTAVFNQIAREAPGAFAGLKAVMFGGEAADCDAVRKVLASDPPQRLLHVYGPTESTTFASWYPVTAVPIDAATIPIGYPLANTTLYVLDENMRPVPPGVPGELYIGGDGLARGYLNQPELSAERFVLSPFAAGQRLYKTGDRVRYGDDGAIEFIGRFDNQVKLRGFRIELGEVESALRVHPGIDDAVVTLRQGGSGEQQLVAHIVMNDGDESSPSNCISGLRAYLDKKLPHYMVPGAFMMMDALPLTPNGKVDRQALPDPDADCARPLTDQQKPRTEVERCLATIWAEVLGLKQVGIDQQFLDLGGHSLLASRVVTRIREELNVDLPLADFYKEVNVSGLASHIESLGPASLTSEAPGIQPVPRNQVIPVSFSQEQVIFLNLLTPNSLAYNTQMSIRFAGKLDIAALERALNEIVRRHEIFRTSFEIVDDLARQKIHSDWRLELPLVDLSELAAEHREARLQEVVADEIRQRFDISEIPLIRWKLLKLEADEHLLLHVEHHLVHDGWSFGVFIGELQILYDAYSNGHDSPLPELPIQYADFVIWQRQRLQGDRLQSLLNYWKQRLAPPLPVLELPTDFQRPPMQSHRGAEEVIDLSAELADQLRELSLRENSTLYVTALSIFFILLQKYSGQTDIIVGTGVANRGLREVEGLIGMFVNALPLRADLSDDPDFHEIVRRVHAMAFEAYEYQELPFEKLVEEITVDRDLAYNPVFQVLFSFHDSQVPALEFPELKGTVNYLHNGSAKFDLNLVVIPWAEQMIGLDSGSQDRRITMKWEYATDLFEPSTIRAMTLHYQNLVQELVRHPNKPLSELSMLSHTERRQLLEDWNQVTGAYTADRTLVELFESQASKTPDAVALEYEGEMLSYDQLNQRANQLARYLRARGVGPEVMVGLMLPRGLEMIVGLVGILKAGGAYVPLDSDYPRSRIEFMLQDARVPVLLTQAELKPWLPGYGGQVVCLDSDWSAIATQETTDLTERAGTDATAYVIYTSGSTGKPKGVMVAHRNVARLFKATESCYGFNESDVWTMFHSIAFDFSVWEIWGALLHGGRLVIVPYTVSRSPVRFHQMLQRVGVTVLNQTPSAFRQLMEADKDRAAASLDALRLVIFGGEALDPQSLQPWFDKHGELQPRLVNMYGITETTVHVTYRPLNAAVVSSGASLIGRAIPDLQIYILDPDCQLVPVGVPGEMYIGGAGLAKGYLNRPELTAERFIANPFGRQQGERLYKTGDLARYRPDGDIEYLGRSDHQVKIRGFRIELGEIESSLSQHPGVRDAAVLVREHDAGDRRLIAYVVAEPEATPDPAGLRNHLRADLPDYMQPAAFVVLKAFPLTANGKLDRDALPLPEDMRDGYENEYAPPRSEREQQLTGIWCEVLKLDYVGIHDNFFDLGGHSLLATQVMSRVRERLGVELPLSEIFSNPTVAQLMPVIEMLQEQSTSEATETISPIPRDGELAPSFAQQRLWFLDQLEPGTPAYNVPGAIRLVGRLDIDALRASLQEIIDRHEVLRTTFAMRDGQLMQQVHPDLLLELPLVDFGGLAEKERSTALRRAMAEDAIRPFDLAVGPMVRYCLLVLAPAEHVLLFTMHHIVADAWSLSVLFRELSALYAAYSRGRENPLPALKVQYADFAVWQRRRLDGELLQEQLDYWKRQLDRAGTLQLPTDRPRPVVQTYNGAHASMLLDETLSSRLDTITRQHELTHFMSLLAAFTILLQRYCAQDEVVVGTPIANRHYREIEDLIGFFVNTLVMRSDLSGNPTFVELSNRIKKTALGAYEHQDLPFETLVDELQLERDRSRNPLFQVLFVVQNAPAQSLALEGLKLERMESVAKTTRFDLELHIWQEKPQLRMKIAYNTDLFDAATIERFFVHYRNLLEQIAENPEVRITDLTLLTKREYQQIVVDWNRTEASFPPVLGVHELFAAQVAATPEAIALEFEGEALSYRELNTRANRLANFLREQGVGPDRVVGVCLPRGLDAVIAVLAVLKAGGAYTPLDPAYPQARLVFMLEESCCVALITCAELAQAIPPTDARVILMDELAALSEYDSQDAQAGTQGQHTAYVIFTSGSTGRPKGIVMSHAALSNMIQWQLQRSAAVGRGRTLQFSAFSFDVSFQEIFATLCAGGTLVVVSEALRRDPAQLLEFLEREAIDRVFMPFAGLNQLSEAAQNRGSVPGSLREVVTAGEALQITPAIENLFRRLNGCSLDNHYGPSESHVVTAHRLEGDPQLWPRLPPIGRPIANARVYLLDRDMHPVPIGVPGHMYLAGNCLATGYIGRADLTEEKFVDDPFAEETGSKMYCSGDLARYAADGSIEYLGRIDSQVKLRGYRIEPGEIETVIRERTDVQACVAMVREDQPGDKRLVAYYVGPGLSQRDLREGVKKELPDYMLPSIFVELESLPLTPSGKIDRGALPQPSGERQENEPYLAPRTPVERQLVDIWQEVLKVDPVGIHDNFFELGGHSLMATQVVSRIGSALNLRLPVAKLFSHPDIAGLARQIEVFQLVEAEQSDADSAGDREELTL